MPSTKILMVCLGNICRSPLAEGILKSKVNLQNIQVDSAGTAAYHVGSLPDIRSIQIAEKYYIDITNQRARKIQAADLEVYDYIYAMDVSNYQNILAIATSEAQKKKVKMIMKELYPSQEISVPDPYYGGVNGFEEVYQMLDKACDVIAQKLHP